MVDTSESLGRGVRAALALTLTLAGCALAADADTGMPTSNDEVVSADAAATQRAVEGSLADHPRPAKASDPESAVSVYRAVKDLLGASPAMSLDLLETVAGGQRLAQARSDLTELREQGWVVQGRARVTDMVTSQGEHSDEFVVTGCTDATGLAVVDARGLSVHDDGPRRTRATFTVRNDAGSWLVTDKEVLEAC